MIATADTCTACARPAGTYAGATVCLACDAPPAVCPCRPPDRAPVPAVHAGPCCDRNATIAAIRSALRRRTGRAWSVTGGRGTAWGWVKVTAPPARRTWRYRLRAGATDNRPEDYEAFDTGRPDGYMSPDDAAMLAEALGLPRVSDQGELIPADHDYRIEYVDRAEGRTPSRIGRPYWD